MAGNQSVFISTDKSLDEEFVLKTKKRKLSFYFALKLATGASVFLRIFSPNAALESVRFSTPVFLGSPGFPASCRRTPVLPGTVLGALILF